MNNFIQIENLEEMDKFFEKQSEKIMQEDIERLSRPLSIKVIEFINNNNKKEPK